MLTAAASILCDRCEDEYEHEHRSFPLEEVGDGGEEAWTFRATDGLVDRSSGTKMLADRASLLGAAIAAATSTSSGNRSL